MNLGARGKTPILAEQMMNIVDQLYPDENSRVKFLEEKTEFFQPISLSLYVLNDDLWKIMVRKEEHPDRMLPMTTIPWFYWEKEAETRGNPSGVRRVSDSNKPLKVKLRRDSLLIRGGGGDFCGLLIPR